MALGEEKAELEAPVDTKSQSFRRWSLKEQEKGPEPEQPPCQEAEGGPASPVCRTEGQPALSCWAGADPSNASGIYLPQASVARRAVVANGPRPALGVLLPPAITGTGDLLHPVGSQMEETKLSASRGLPQTVNTPRTTALCSGHNADTEDDPSPVDSPQVPGLSQQPPISGAPFPSQRRSMDSAGEDSLVNNQALRVSSGLLKSHPSPTVLDKWPFSDPDAEGHLLRKAEEQRKDSLVQCVQTFCCQLEELIHWLYNVTDVTDLGTPPQSSLTGLKSSLQFYRQFKRDIHEHQSLTESVLEKGETLLQCLLDSTPVLKDVLGRISKQSGELESHADRLYDSILASMDMLAGCSLIPDNKPVAATEPPHAGV
ncbi:centrosomal protein of 68 kDa isoform X2 [Heterocephalus glaber]|uniref:Centrosomal protein of 68 kDa n=1 Tax=Heterocephalus glaber TaxID=10181 RepID=A0AAX6TCU4_HETGA|nr:centrosomal protein of 68 kDa isoform X2 [Heterocephalus glaber]